MGSITTTENENELLLAFLETADEAESDRLLAQLIRIHAQPLIRDIIKATLRFYPTRAEDGSEGQDSDDLSSEVVLSLLKRLRDVKAKPNGREFGSFRSYVAVTTYNACYAYLRRLYPQRHRLKSRLRYTLTRHSNFALWENRNNKWLCGLAEWRDDKSPASRNAHQDFAVSRQRPQTMNLTDLLTSIFCSLGRPVEFDELVGIVADLQQVTDYPLGTIQIPAPDALVSVATELEQRQYLEHLWMEIRKLPFGQRTALLLNLKDRQGRELVTLLAQIRIATFAEIADALAMSTEQFNELWNALPVDDNFIADHLKLTRQQVINLRLSARRRLAKRMKITGEQP